jgi:hypothetical protein
LPRQPALPSEQELAEGIRLCVGQRQQSVLAAAQRALAEAQQQEAGQTSGDNTSSRESTSPAPSSSVPSSPNASPQTSLSAPVIDAAAASSGEEDDEEEEKDLSDWEYRPAYLYNHRPQQSEDCNVEDDDYHETEEARQAR